MDHSTKESGIITERVEALLANMTLKEKVGQVNQKMYGWEAFRKTETGYELTETFKEHVRFGDGIGVLYGLFRSDPWSGITYENGIPENDCFIVANMIQQYIKDHTRLGIPVLLSEECSHGHQGLDSLITPVNLGVGATWNPELHEELMSVVAEQVRAKGAHLALVSTLDILRDPRWGRSEECFGEDPYLAARFTEAVVKGLQGEESNTISDSKMIAVLKHFAAQGNGMGGHNAAPASIGERELREIHLPPMISAIQSGALACMAAYNEIDGIPCHANGYLLNQILREELGFKGAVMADGCALDLLVHLTESREKAAALALDQKEDKVITVLQGITILAGDAEVAYEKGCGIRSLAMEGMEKAVGLADSSDVAIVVLGGSSARNFNAQFDLNGAVVDASGEEEMDCGENIDVADLELGGRQLQMVQEIIKTGTPTVVVLIQGRPHAIPWIAEHAPAILSAWYPGQMGGQAIAEVLFGHVNPSGKLPVSIPRSSMQLPVFYNYKDGGFKKDYLDMTGKALYPFGFGLSYTEFNYENLRCSEQTIPSDKLAAGEKFKIIVEVTNSGGRDGFDVIQFYVKGKGSSITRRVKELKGFKKVWLAAGETKEVTLELAVEELQVFSSKNKYEIEKGYVEIEVGSPVNHATAILEIG